MSDVAGNWITYNGEVYNYRELRDELGRPTRSAPTSDTEVILAAYRRWGADCVDHLRGHVRVRDLGRARTESYSARATASASSPSTTRSVGDVLYFASEAKALLPFVPTIETDLEALKEYLAFQFCLGGPDALQGISASFCPGHTLVGYRRDQ